ncbi:hypothetical protein IGI39_004821 [Enterococcus sp. AZ135]|uniref:alpha/beta fold hydrolase n=1 Tax=unclassified Enterococcus TaxID=2608891 RepID=UPI003F230D11
MPTFKHDGIEFNYKVDGEGIPFLYLHGLGDTLEIAFNSYKRTEGIKLIALDQRGHGNSGHDFTSMNFCKLAGDAVALMNYLGITKFYVGGLSMGAGVALNIAIHEPKRVLGLILLRSSSTDEPMKEEVRHWFSTVSKYLPKKNGKQLFKEDPLFHSIKEACPRAIETFTRYFEDTASVRYFQKFLDMPNDSPIKNKEELAYLSIPVLILSNKYDVIHPIEYSLFYKENIKNATYFELTPKTINAERHKQELDTYINNFIIENEKRFYCKV